MKVFITAVTFSCLIAPASFVHSASAAPPMDATRENAIHECNVKAQSYRQYTWGNTEIHTYRTCMMEHGHQE